MTEQEQYSQPRYAEPKYAGSDDASYQSSATSYSSDAQSQQQYASFQNNPNAQYGAPQNFNYGYQQNVPTDKSKLAAGILGILLGAFGAHKFYLGYTKEAVIMLLVTLLTFGFGAFVMAVIGLAEGIIYLTKSDTDFYNTYVAGHKGWF